MRSDASPHFASGSRPVATRVRSSRVPSVFLPLLLPLLLTVLCLLPVACGGGSDQVTPDGTWTIDVAATLAANQEQIDEQVASLLGPEQEDARRQLEGIFEGMSGTIELNADGTLVSRTSFAGQEQEMRGTWEAEGGTVTTRARADGGAEEQVLSGAIEGEHLTLSDGGNQIIVLRRG